MPFHNLRSFWMLAVLAIAVACVRPRPVTVGQPEAVAVSAGPKTLRIVAFNDFHGALEPRKDSAGTLRGGAIALAAEIARARAECKHPECVSLLLDGGDEFQGTAASNFAFGKPVVELFNHVGVSASALGNHEFDWGQDTLRARMKQAHYPVLGANVLEADGSDVPWIADDTVLTAGGVKIGVVGIATTETARTTKASNVADLRFVPPLPIVNERARALRKRGASIVIVLAHAGAFCRQADPSVCDGEIVSLATQLTEPIDAFVSGHTHSPVAVIIRGAAVMQARARGTAIAVADIPLPRPCPGCGSRASQPTVQLRDVIPRQTSEDDTTVARIVRDATNSLKTRLSQPITRVAERMSGGSNGSLGNLIADAQRWAAHGDVAVMNAGGVRASLDSGVATFGAIFEIQPFGNSLVRLTVTGTDLRTYLEGVVSQTPLRAFLSGVVVRYDSSRPVGSRVLDVRLSDGRSVDLRAEYAVVMSDFLAAGGDGLNLAGSAIRTEALSIIDLDAFIGYLRGQPEPLRAPQDIRLLSVTP